MQMRKRALPFLIILILLLSACDGTGIEQTTPTPTPDLPVATATVETITVTIYGDFANGMPVGNIREREITVPVENGPASRSQIALILADELSKWTGLDFTLNGVSFPANESIRVDWSKKSTLLAGPGDRDFKEGFRFFDGISLNWFMMDSLERTFKKNLGVTILYFQSDGQPLSFPNPVDMAQFGLEGLPVDQSYEGSAFFIEHRGGRGDLFDDPLSGPEYAGGMGDVIEYPDYGTEFNDGPNYTDGSWVVDEPIAEGVIFAGSLLKSDPGENMTPYEAASGLYEHILSDKLVLGTDYSAQLPMYITCVDVVNIDGKECYLLSVSGMFNTKAWEYAVDYDYGSQYVYLLSEMGPQYLGSFLTIGNIR